MASIEVATPCHSTWQARDSVDHFAGPLSTGEQDEMTAVFFPSPLLAWGYVVSLISVLSAASIIDWKTLRIPKFLSLGLFAGGLAASVVRGGWLGQEGHPVWLFPPSGPWIGACDGLLLALCSALAGFVSFFILWMLGVCGGGDVKLVTATAAWIDPYRTVLIMAVSLTLVCLWIVLAFSARLISGRIPQVKPAGDHRSARDLRLRGRRISYSLPLAISTVIVVLASWYGELVPAASRPPAQLLEVRP
jgi:Flp pilus assembly protein protease CpaA